MSFAFELKIFEKLTPFELYSILKSRQEVFQIEQGIHYVDCDDFDLNSYHLCLWDKSATQQNLVAYLRILPPGKYLDHSIGRVLTTQKYRKKGHGKAIMEYLLETANLEIKATHFIMAAQSYLKDFYQEFGFKVISKPFMEEGIEHLKMRN